MSCQEKITPATCETESAMFCRQLMIVIIAYLSCAALLVQADTFHLRSGGSLTGELQNPDQEPRSTYVVRLATGGDLTLDAKVVERIVTLSAKQRKYAELLARMPADSEENHWTMAQWCKNQGMTRQRDFHLEHVISHDPDHELARRALKYKRQADGSWARNDELWRADGYVPSRGRWRLPQQVSIDQRKKAQEDARLQWKRDLKMWRGWLGNSKRRQLALANILKIDDPLAADSLADMFREARNYELREELAEILGRLDSQAATNALIRAAMVERDAELRLHCTKQLKENKSKRRTAVRTLIGELNSQDNGRINLAATALGRLDDESAILPLIKALRTEHKVRIRGNTSNMNVAFNRDGSSRGGLGGMSMGKRPTTAIKMFDNKGVRNALIALTDKDFEFNQPQWKGWYVARTTPENLDLRRDP